MRSRHALCPGGPKNESCLTDLAVHGYVAAATLDQAMHPLVFLYKSFLNHAKVAVRRVGLTKHISAPTFCHSFATHLLQRGTGIRTIQQLLGHNDGATSMIYPHIQAAGWPRCSEPLGRSRGLIFMLCYPPYGRA
jgi:Phage integrase family